MANELLTYFTLFTAVLLFGSFAALYCERTGLINIAVNGQMIFGGLVFGLLGNFLNQNEQLNNGMQFVFMLVAIAVGMLISWLYSFITITLRGNQIIAGTAINLLALGSALFALAFPQVKGHVFLTHFQAVSLPRTNHIVNVYFLISLLLVGGTLVFFRYTRYGVYFVACGENHHAVDAVGISVIKIRYLASMLSGALGALAGCVYTFTISQQFQGNVQGIGFTTLAIMIFGQWRTIFITMGCFIFGGLYTFADYLPYLDNVPGTIQQNKALFKTLPFVGTIIVMIGFYRFSNEPLVNGIPFVRGQR